MSKLDKMREKVKKIDHNIIKQIRERLNLTEEIGELKRKTEIPLRNWEVEKRVVDNAKNSAKTFELSEEFISNVMKTIIKESIIHQEKIHYSAYRGNKENILIIGGLGEMGKWFSFFFQSQGHNVLIFDKKGKSDYFESFDNLNDAVKKASCILIATPIKTVPDIIKKVVEQNFKGVVFDICSLKYHLKPSINIAIENNIKITSIHPMFGPKARTLSDKILCICDCGNEKASNFVEKFFRDTAISIVKLSIKEHDKAISYVLGLSHIINIVFLKILKDSGYKYKELKNIASTTFNSQMITSSSVINEDPLLYYSIQKFNPFKKDLYNHLNKAVKQIISLILKGKSKTFIDIIEESKKWINK